MILLTTKKGEINPLPDYNYILSFSNVIMEDILPDISSPQINQQINPRRRLGLEQLLLQHHFPICRLFRLIVHPIMLR